jgi:hypothetical protein
MRATTIDIGGRRVARVGTYELDHGDGDPPSLRVFIATGWASSGALPFGPELVDLPASALPALREALASLEGEA